MRETVKNAPNPNTVEREEPGRPVIPDLPTPTHVTMKGVDVLGHVTEDLSNYTIDATHWIHCAFRLGGVHANHLVSRIIMRVAEMVSSSVVLTTGEAMANPLAPIAEVGDTVRRAYEDGTYYRYFDLSHYIHNDPEGLYYFVIKSSGSGSVSLSSSEIYFTSEYENLEQVLNDTPNESAQTSSRDNLSVNMLSGRGIYACQVVKVDSPRLSWNLSAVFDSTTYNKTAYNNFPLFAKGWRWNLAQTVYSSGSDYFYWDGDRKLHRFIACANNANVYYEVSTNSGLYLVVGANDIIITDDITVKMTFVSGRLTEYKTIGVNASSMSLAYDNAGKLTTIVDDFGDTYSITYGTTAITVSLGNTIVATVALLLSRVTDITRKNRDGSSLTEPSTQFTYGSTGQLITIYATDTHKQIAITYNASQYITSLACGSQGTNNTRHESYRKFDYTARHTIISFSLSENDTPYRWMNYDFDPDGKLISGYESKDGTPCIATSFSKIEQATMTDFAVNSLSILETYYYAYQTSFDISANTNMSSHVQISLSEEESRYHSFMVVASVKVTKVCTESDAHLVFEWDGHSVQREVNLALKDQEQLLTIPVDNLSSDTITVRITATDFDCECHVNGVYLCACKKSEEKDYVNISTPGGSLITVEGNTWYLLSKASIRYRATSGGSYLYLNNVILTADDLIRTTQARVYTTSHSSMTGHNVWYDGGKMLYNVVDTKYKFLSTYYAISSFKVARISHIHNRYDISFCFTSSAFQSYSVFKQIAISSTTFISGYVQFDSLHQPIAERTPEGAYTTKTYTNNMLTRQAIGSFDTSLTGIIRHDSSYTTDGLLSSQTTYRESDDLETSYTYDNNHRVEVVTPPRGGAFRYYYQAADPDKLTLFLRGNIGCNNTINYAGENITSLVDYGNAPIVFGYDQFNDPSSVSITGSSGTAYSLGKSILYNVNGTMVTTTTKGAQVTRRTYDKYGRLIKIEKGIVNNLSTVRTYIYNDNDDIGSITNPTDSSLTVSSSSLLFRICDWVNNVCMWIDYQYNQFGDIIQIKAISNTELYRRDFTYDEYGRLLTDTLKQSGFPLDLIKAYTYRSQVDDRVLYVHNQYAATPYVTRTEVATDAIGRVSNDITITEFNTEHKLKNEYQYYPADTGGLTRDVSVISQSLLNGNNQVIGTTQNVAVEYDENGNITRYGNDYYTYDNADRLVREDNYGMNKSYVYAYNSKGNITSKKTYAYTTGTLGAVESELTYGYDTTWLDQLLSVGGQACAYNAAAQPTTYRGNAFTWTNGNLVTAKGISMAYLGDGTRVQKGSTKYYYSDGKLLLQTKSNEHIRFLYADTDTIGFQRQVGNTEHMYFYRRNLLGDIIAIYDTNDQLLARYVYDAWGNHKVLNPNGTENTNSSFIGNINPLRYRGYYYDRDLELYYLMTRYYDPEIGRFISADGIEYLDPETIGGLNLFAYCNNNPVMGTDPDGTQEIPLLALLRKGLSHFISKVESLSKSVGCFVRETATVAKEKVDLFFGGVEMGSYFEDVFGDDSKKLSFFVQPATKWWRFWEYQIGVKRNFDDCSISFSVGVGEKNISYSANGHSYCFKVGISETGFLHTYNNGGGCTYEYYYLRTIPTVLLCVAVATAPSVLPAVVPLLALV